MDRDTRQEEARGETTRCTLSLSVSHPSKKRTSKHGEPHTLQRAGDKLDVSSTLSSEIYAKSELSGVYLEDSHLKIALSNPPFPYPPFEPTGYC